MSARALSIIGITFAGVLAGRMALIAGEASAKPDLSQAEMAQTVTAEKLDASFKQNTKSDKHNDDPVHTPANKKGSKAYKDIDGKSGHIRADFQEDIHTDEDGKLSGRGGAQCLSGDIAVLLKKRGNELDARENRIAERDSVLAALEDKLEQKLSVVAAANKELEKNVTLLKATANQDILHLVEMYQTMKPKQAAEIFNSMDPSFAAGFLREMNGQNAGLILANMDARKSYAISVIIAGRNAKYRKKEI